MYSESTPLEIQPSSKIASYCISLSGVLMFIEPTAHYSLIMRKLNNAGLYNFIFYKCIKKESFISPDPLIIA